MIIEVAEPIGETSSRADQQESPKSTWRGCCISRCERLYKINAHYLIPCLAGFALAGVAISDGRCSHMTYINTTTVAGTFIGTTSLTIMICSSYFL